MQHYLTNHWPTVVLALLAFVVWTAGNALKKKLLIGIGIALCVLALLSYAHLFDFLFEL